MQCAARAARAMRLRNADRSSAMRLNVTTRRMVHTPLIKFRYGKGGAARAAPSASPAAAPAAAPQTSLQEGSPLYYLTVECRVDRALQLCHEVGSDRFEYSSPVTKILRSGSNASAPLSWDAIALKASCAAMRAVPAANSAWLGPEATRMFHQVHVECRASDGSSRVLADAGSLGLSGLSAGMAAPGGDAAAPTFTVDFLGEIAFGRQRLGVGQSATLTLSEPVKKLVPAQGDELEQALVVQATLTCDHRTVDGALGATWLKHFKQATENPVVLLL